MSTPSRLLAIVALTTGCVRGSGTLAERTVPVGTIERIDNNSLVDVEVVRGEAGDGTLSCDDNLLDLIQVDVIAATLNLSMAPGRFYRTESLCRLIVSSENLVGVAVRNSGGILSEGPFDAVAEVRNAGTGLIRLRQIGGTRLDVDSLGTGAVILTGIDVEELAATLEGEGTQRLSGSAVSVALSSPGNGDLDARDLVTPTARADALGGGRVDVFASRTATVRLGGTGNVYVWGEPELDVIVTGTGEVLPSDEAPVEDTGDTDLSGP
ncbi:MAG: DUF2807 domain-containing protein [Alphaproteobacteria bacterium]|nr:DUF2807 domain-containing protein [Alphaproteobacteria bacterium]